MIRASLLLLAACSLGPSTTDTEAGPAITDPGDTGGDDTEDSREPPRTCADTPWAQLSASAEITCGTHVDGCVECWGHAGFGGEYDGCLTGNTGCVSFQNFHEDQVEVANASMVAVAPLGPYGGDYDTTRVCALDRQGTVSCWGFQWEGPMEPVYRPGMRQIAVSRGAVCGVTEDDGPGSSIECWDPTGGGAIDVRTSEPVRDVHGASWDSLCRTSEHSGGCFEWWYDALDEPSYHELSPAPPGNAVLEAEATGQAVWCAVDDTFAMRCSDWRGDPVPREFSFYPPAGRLVSDACFLKENNCALDDRGSPFCWGSWPEQAIDATPAAALDLPLHGLTCGMYHACALTEDGEAVCWGDNSAGQAAPPGGYVLTSGTQTLWDHNW